MFIPNEEKEKDFRGILEIIITILEMIYTETEEEFLEDHLLHHRHHHHLHVILHVDKFYNSFN